MKKLIYILAVCAAFAAASCFGLDTGTVGQAQESQAL